MAVRSKKTSRSKTSLKAEPSREKSPTPEAPAAAAEAVRKVAPTAEQEAYWKAFHEMLEKSSEIVEWKVSRTLEEAKALSVNEDFQKAVAEIRQRYGIEPRIQSKLVDPGAVIHEYTSHLDEAGREKLENDLSALAKRFDLAWAVEGEDYGLVVGALCYGLTPEILTCHWEEIRYSMAKTRTPGVKLMLDAGQNLKEKLADQIVISYLFFLLRQNGISVSLPEPIQEIVREALGRIGRVGLSAERAAEAISSIQEKYLTPELYIRVVRNTTLEDIKRTWPQVEMRKVEWLRGDGGKRTSPRRGRTWRTYERDIYVWRRVNRDGLTYEDAYDAWLRDHPEDPAVELSAVIRSVKRIKFVPEEVPEINSAD